MAPIWPTLDPPTIPCIVYVKAKFLKITAQRLRKIMKPILSSGS